MPDADAERGRRIIERGSVSFALAARLLAPAPRLAAYQLYAWCRHCDDRIDAQHLGHGQRVPVGPAAAAHLAALTEATAQALRAGDAPDPVFRGLARVVRQHGIPERHPFELLEGLGMDVAGRRYRTFDDLRPYCYGVAGVVGVMMAYIMGAKRPLLLARAEDLGIAMQLTNIARDVLDDARAGRVYLPTDWLVEAGVDPDAVGDPARRAGVAAVVARLLDRADALYRGADDGIAQLPFREAWSIGAARAIYADIGRVVRRRGVRAWDQRARVPTVRKQVLVAYALGRTIAAGARS
jgi:phytoene synthase